MNKFIITTSSAVDLSSEYLKENDIKYSCLTYMVDGDEQDKIFENYDEAKAFYDKMRGGSMTKTSQINVEQFVGFFGEQLDKGLDILHIEFSSGISGTANSAKLAAEELAEKYPDRKLVVIDTLAASLGAGILVTYAVRMKDDGKSLDETAAFIRDNMMNMNHWVAVDDLVYLKRGGRISGTSAAIGTALNLKPIIEVNVEGKLISRAKIRGRKKSIVKLIDIMREKIKNPDGQIIGISHSDCLDEAKEMKKAILKEFKTSEVLISSIGPIIGAHTGPGTIALFFLGDERVDL